MWFNKKETEKKNNYFSEEWISEWKKSINKSDDYKKKGKGWNAPLIIKFDPVPEIFKENDAIGIYLNLKYGSCEEARYAKNEDIPKCDIVLTADEKTWVQLMEKGQDPTMLIMKNRLKMEKGSLVLLSTQKKAAESLLKTAPSYSDTHSSSALFENDKIKPRSHDKFATTSRGLNRDSFPMQLFQKAKVYGTWNPTDIDLSKDKNDWEKLDEGQKKIITHLSGLFMAGEEAVTLDLLPLMGVIAKEGRIEEEIYLTSFLWEEAKHTEFFARYTEEVMIGPTNFEEFHGPLYKVLFYEKLPRTLSRLETDPSPLAQLKASATYNIIVEGTLAETGYEAYHKMLKENDIMPGMQEGITKLKQDESRHIAYALYLIERLLKENKKLVEPLEKELEDLLYDATNIIQEIFSFYDDEQVPFGLEKEWFLNHAVKQFQKRLHALGLDR